MSLAKDKVGDSELFLWFTLVLNLFSTLLFNASEFIRGQSHTSSIRSNLYLLSLLGLLGLTSNS